ncbi:MAG TPA: serine/threonine-protein kinase [Pirellulales bacterium]|jgi:serine/threonine protein kinase|nr:serine/threonine-protein kinase [Pirellulales bacterium]
MTLPIAEFWKLAVQSRLLSRADCQKLEAAFSHVKGAANQGNATAMGEWLVAKRALSRYQVQTLLAGRPGPFIFGDYCVYERVRSKEGRLAGLYRAMHVPTRHPVLLYFMPPEIAKNDEAWQAAAHQVAWACWIGHPFICECHHLLDLGQFKLLAIENLPGAPAAERLAGGSRLSPQDACRLAYQAALGLARMHQLGLVHGEIRPDNLWLTPDGNLKLLQIPLAPEPLRGPGPLDWNNPTAKLLMAADYAAPELASEGRPPDALTDIYALGATLFHLVRGTPPFAGGDLTSKLPRHATEPVQSLAALGVSTKLDQVLAYMMAKDPGQRYQQAVQVAEALAYFVDPAAASALPMTVPTLPAYDQWLRQQSRVPGMEPGSIPTGLQMAESAAAQFAAAQQSAEQSNPAEQHLAAGGAASAQEPGYFDPSSAPDQQFESFATPTPDPLDFVPARTSAPVLDLDSVLDTASEPLRARPIAVGKRKSRGIDLTALAILGGVLTLAAIAGVFIWINVKGARDQSDDATVATGQHTDHRDSPEKSISGGATGSKQTPGAQTSASTTGTANPAAPESGAGRSTKSDARPAEQNPLVSPKADSPEPVADDGHLLWASPTSGPPLELNYIASGAQVVLAVRPAGIVGRAGGDQILPALGPWGADAEQMLKTLTGLPLAQIDRVIAVWHDSGSGQLVPTLIVRTQEKLAAASLLPAWGNPSAAKEGDETYYQGRLWSYYLPAKEGDKLLVFGPTALIKEVIQSAGGSPAMSAHLERMLKDTDSDRDVTIAFVPGPLLSDNQGFFVGELAALRKPADTFFGDDVKAGLLSLHFKGNFFIEMRVLGTGDNPGALSSQFADRARSLPDMVENALNELNIHRYGVKLLHRFPEQLRVLAENTRNDTEDDEAVLRCYLPGVATQNLLLATELALAEQPLKGGPSGDSGGERPQSIAELLKKKTTLTFPRDTLEKSLQMLLDDVGVKYEILGADLQLEGITKNQSFGLDEKDKPAGEILRKIMLLANADGKLVYVIKPKQPGGPETLFITTRASAAKRGDKLPPELQSATKPPPKKKS